MDEQEKTPFQNVEINLLVSQKEARREVESLIAKSEREIAVVGLMGVGKTTALTGLSGGKVIDVERRDKIKESSSEPIILSANPLNVPDITTVVIKAATHEEIFPLVAKAAQNQGINLTLEQQEEIAEFSMGVPGLVSTLCYGDRQSKMTKAAYFLEAHLRFKKSYSGEEIKTFFSPYLNMPIPEEVLNYLADLTTRKEEKDVLSDLEKKTADLFVRELGERNVPFVLRAKQSFQVYRELFQKGHVTVEGEIRKPHPTNISLICPAMDEAQMYHVQEALAIIPYFHDLHSRRLAAVGSDRKYSLICSSRERVEKDMREPAISVDDLSRDEKKKTESGVEFFAADQAAGNGRTVSQLLKLAALIPKNKEGRERTYCFAFESTDHSYHSPLNRTYAVETMLQQLDIPYIVSYGPKMVYTYDAQKQELILLKEAPLNLDDIVNMQQRRLAEEYTLFFLGKTMEELWEEK